MNSIIEYVVVIVLYIIIAMITTLIKLDHYVRTSKPLNDYTVSNTIIKSLLIAFPVWLALIVAIMPVLLTL